MHELRRSSEQERAQQQEPGKVAPYAVCAVVAGSHRECAFPTGKTPALAPTHETAYGSTLSRSNQEEFREADVREAGGDDM
jgi:hypothetical protein